MFLPREILDAIFGYFAPKSSAFDLSIEEHCANRKTLASLCRVSKHFKAIAMPQLYANVRLFDGDIRFFTTTILANLGTRRLVTRLSLEFMLPGTWDANEVSEERRQSVPRMDQEQWDYDHCLRETLALLGQNGIATGVGGADILIAEGLELHDQFEEDLSAVLLFVLPELQHLQVKLDPMSDLEDYQSAGYWRCKMFLQALRLPFYAKSQRPNSTNLDIQPLTPASLFNLRELILCSPFEDPGTVKSTWPPIVFGYIEEMQPFWGLPKLKSLTLERAESTTPLRMPKDAVSSVEHLHLVDTAIPPGELPELLKHFPLLRTITYVPADYSGMQEYAELSLDCRRLNKKKIEDDLRSLNSKLEIIKVEIPEVPEWARESDSEEEDEED
ncbi:hypothetical protein PFICI_10792 [Pestalotiopsis fici W106-1]|uniref:Uncharacterized protein n=1 Tax=Pestalotiopsis fici (strain W106-1 / CGMCC3.15140) TaxID=1229662 RepID=W3WSS3_PESFW|nr:uncharacterized protein PFICI_10792 [Pestalotiopsis fici W106-1]ETS76918.1 hypothetical protein PFICI_10792 [Pestalotiopsis fici W106-1]